MKYKKEKSCFNQFNISFHISSSILVKNYKEIVFTEGLVDGQVGLDDEHGSSGGLRLLEDVATPTIEDTVDTADSVFRTLKRRQIAN